MRQSVRVGKENTRFELVDREGRPWNLGLPMGTSSIAEKHFRRRIPNEAEVESAINEIEDLLMSDGRLRDFGGTLFTSDSAMRGFFPVADQGPVVVPLSEFEAKFRQASLVAVGGSSTMDGVDMTPESLAWLLVTREILHHLGFDSMTFLA